MKLYTLDNQFIKETDDFPFHFTGIIESTMAKQWIVEGRWHRLDGPAIEYPNGSKEWWVNHKQYTEEQHKLLHSIMKLKGLL